MSDVVEWFRPINSQAGVQAQVAGSEKQKNTKKIQTVYSFTMFHYVSLVDFWVCSGNMGAKTRHNLWFLVVWWLISTGARYGFSGSSVWTEE